MVSERQVDHREVRPVEDRSTGLQGLVDLFLLELQGGRTASWHVVASRRVGVFVGEEFRLGVHAHNSTRSRSKSHATSGIAGGVLARNVYVIGRTIGRIKKSSLCVQIVSELARGRLAASRVLFGLLGF